MALAEVAYGRFAKLSAEGKEQGHCTKREVCREEGRGSLTPNAGGMRAAGSPVGARLVDNLLFQPKESDRTGRLVGGKLPPILAFRRHRRNHATAADRCETLTERKPRTRDRPVHLMFSSFLSRAACMRSRRPVFWPVVQEKREDYEESFQRREQNTAFHSRDKSSD